MKKLIIVFIFICMQNLIAHEQHTHQEITLEAYKLLKSCFPGGSFKSMQDHLGSQIGYGGNGLWTTGLILAGAWREDMEDPVYNYSNDNPPLMTGWSGSLGDLFSSVIKALNDNNEYYSSVTHFWEPDNGNELKSDIKTKLSGFPTFGVPTIMTVPNAYQKIKAYANGNWEVLGTQDWLFKYNGKKARLTDLLSQSFRRFYYSDLINLYKTGWVQIKGLAFTNYVIECESGSNVGIQPTNGTIRLQLNDETKNQIVWEILGRMCHLLQDMTIPSHVHNDAHGDSEDGIKEDPYETSFGSIQWTADQVQNYVGGLFDLSTINDPLHYLMFINAQMSDHFAGAGPYSSRIDDLIEGNYSSQEYDYLNALNLPMWGEPTTFNSNLSSDQKTNIRSKLIPQAIRSTATLLYWFAQGANLEFVLDNPAAIIEPVVRSMGSGRAGTTDSWDFHISNSGNVTLNLDIWSSVWGLEFVGEDSHYHLHKTLLPGETIEINYFSSFGRYDYGQFTDVVTIDDDVWNIHKTFSLVGTRLLPDFCLGETQARSVSPEEQLFDGAFLGYFGFASDSSGIVKNKSIKERLDFAYKILKKDKKEKIENICKEIIELYPESEMGISFYAMGLLWEAAYSNETIDFKEKEFKKYLQELTKKKNKYKINGYAQLILSLFNVGNDIKGLEELFSDYQYDVLKELSLFHQFIHYYVYKQDKVKAREASNRLDMMFNESRYGYQAHLIFGDDGYSIEGLRDKMKKKQSGLLAKRSESKNDILSEIPTEYKLYNNYPNPFNPNTSIKYSIPQNSFVTLKIYNMMGQLVKTLVNENKNPGFYTVDWNGTNENSSQVVSGVYFYRFESNNYASTEKMILLK